MFTVRVYIDPATKRGTAALEEPCRMLILRSYRPTTDRTDIPITQQSVEQSEEPVSMVGLGEKPVTIKTTAVYNPGKISIDFTIHHTVKDDVLTVEYTTSNMQGGICYLDYTVNPSKEDMFW